MLIFICFKYLGKNKNKNALWLFQIKINFISFYEIYYTQLTNFKG